MNAFDETITDEDLQKLTAAEADYSDLFGPYEGTKELASVTLWIPKDLKLKYERLQKKSRRKVGQKLKQNFIAWLEKIQEPA
jgi:hypothetical protein